MAPLCSLRGERNGSRSGEHLREPGEHHEVGVKAYATDTERGKPVRERCSVRNRSDTLVPCCPRRTRRRESPAIRIYFDSLQAHLAFLAGELGFSL
jgi:hypothetical protein